MYRTRSDRSSRCDNNANTNHSQIKAESDPRTLQLCEKRSAATLPSMVGQVFFSNHATRRTLARWLAASGATTAALQAGPSEAVSTPAAHNESTGRRRRPAMSSILR